MHAAAWSGSVGGFFLLVENGGYVHAGHHPGLEKWCCRPPYGRRVLIASRLRVNQPTAMAITPLHVARECDDEPRGLELVTCYCGKV